MTAKVRVFITDDHAILRSGLRMLINSQPDMEVVGEAGTLDVAIERSNSVKPDVITLDLGMPGGSAVAGIEFLRRAAPDARILVLTMHDDAAYVRSALALGAAGYVVKSAADSELISAIRAISKGRTFIDVQSIPAIEVLQPKRDTGQAGHATPPIAMLSDREREVFADVARGHTSQEVADRLGLSVKTVESYRARIMQKLGLKSRADLIRLAVECGVLKQGAHG